MREGVFVGEAECADAPHLSRRQQHTSIVSYQAEYEQYTIDQGREMEAMHQQHKAESHVLKLRVQDLEASFADPDRDEEVRRRPSAVVHVTRKQ